MTLLFDSHGASVLLRFDNVLGLKMVEIFSFATSCGACLAPNYDLTNQNIAIYISKEEIDTQAFELFELTVVISILHIYNIYYIFSMCILMFHRETDPTHRESAKEYQSNLESLFKVGKCCTALLK